jgi:hypothetical protein
MYHEAFKSCADAFVSELTEATNELINDDKVVQPLTTAEIEALKQSGVHSSVRTPKFHLAIQSLTTHPTGNHPETDRATCKFHSQDRIQQGKVQEAERSKVPVISPSKAAELMRLKSSRFSKTFRDNRTDTVQRLRILVHERPKSVTRHTCRRVITDAQPRERETGWPVSCRGRSFRCSRCRGARPVRR